jgi:hypothetical protein
MAGPALGAVLRASLAAALAAALLTAAFHFVFTEPVVQQAIDLEAQAGAPSREEVVVSRPVQHAGLFLGFLLYGLTFGLLFAAAWGALGHWSPETRAARRALFLAVTGGWSVAVFPSLKYPANPPGAGDPATIYDRQRLYLAFVALSIAGAVAAFGLDRVLARAGADRLGREARLFLVLALYGGYAAVVYAVMPANPDPVRLPAGLAWKFRALSLAGLALFWSVLGALAALLLGRGRPRPPIAEDRSGAGARR